MAHSKRIEYESHFASIMSVMDTTSSPELVTSTEKEVQRLLVRIRTDTSYAVTHPERHRNRWKNLKSELRRVTEH